MQSILETIISDYLPNLASGLFALLLGIPFGLWLDRIIQNKNQKELKTVLFRALRDETIYNIRQMMNTLVTNTQEVKNIRIPIFYLSSSIWASVINGQQIEALGNAEILRLSLYLYRVIDRIQMNIRRAELMSQEDLENNQVYLEILRKMITSSAREGLDIALSLLNKLDRQLNEHQTVIPGLSELLSSWDMQNANEN